MTRQRVCHPVGVSLPQQSERRDSYGMTENVTGLQHHHFITTYNCGYPLCSGYSLPATRHHCLRDHLQRKDGQFDHAPPTPRLANQAVQPFKP